MDRGCTALSIGICETILTVTSVRVDQICIFQECHFNGIKPEIKDIIVYLNLYPYLTVTSHWNKILFARSVLSFSHRIQQMESHFKSTMTESNHVENEDSPAVIQTDLSPIFLFCPFNMADSELIVCWAIHVLTKLLELVTKITQEAKRGQKINTKHFYWWLPSGSPAVIQTDLSPIFLFCPFNMADSELIVC